MIVDQSQIFTHLAFCAFCGIGAVTAGNRLHNRMYNAAAARGIGRGNGSQQQFGKSETVTDAQRFSSKNGDKQISDTHPQPCFEQTARNHNCDGNQPNQRIGERTQRIAHRRARFVGGYAGYCDQPDGNNRQRAQRHGLADNGGNHTDKHGQQRPSLRLDPVGYGQCQNQGAQYCGNGEGYRFETQFHHIDLRKKDRPEKSEK